MQALNSYPTSLIVNADQTSLFLEMLQERTLETKGARTVHVRTAGYEKERLTVMLAVTASGLKLPPYVVFKRKTIPKVVVPRGSVASEAASEATLFTDNKATILRCREPRLESRVKHINARYFLMRQLQRRGQARFDFVESEANTADIFTKALPPCDHQRCCVQLGLVDTGPRLA
ncbi:unnamed protein product [Closterium sp. NIES-54]